MATGPHWNTPGTLQNSPNSPQRQRPRVPPATGSGYGHSCDFPGAHIRRRGDDPPIQVCPRGTGASILQTTTTNYLASTTHEPLQTMSNILRKRRPTASGTGIEPSSCANSGYDSSPNLLTSHSEKTAAHRCNKDVVRHRKGIGRCSSPPQVMFGRHQCTHQTLRRAFLPGCAPTLLTDLS